MYRCPSQCDMCGRQETQHSTQQIRSGCRIARQSICERLGPCLPLAGGSGIAVLWTCAIIGR
jgi:hypothetical protein